MSPANGPFDAEPALVNPPRPTLADQLAWDGSKLVVTDAELLSLIDRPYLSPSTAKSIRHCGARMVGERALPRRSDVFSAPEKGTAAHLVLERLYALPAALRDVDHAFLIQTDMVQQEPQDGQFDYMRAIGADPVRYAKWTSLVHSAWKGIFDIEDPTTVNVHAREMRLNGVLVGDVPFKGFIDRVDELDEKDGEPALRVVDYKTGRDLSRPNPNFEDEHGDQIRLYRAALEAKTGRRVKLGHLYYIEHGKQRRVAVNDADVKKSVRAFSAAWDLLRAGVERQRFAAQPSALCGWCPLVNSCPVARPATSAKDPRADAASADDLGIPTAAKSARTGTAAGPAAHVRDVGTSDDEQMETRNMGTSTWREGKPWETDGSGRMDGHLAMASYHATAVIGTASLAAEQLHAAGQKVAPSTMRALTAVLADVTLESQSAITHGSTDWGEGSNTRVRGALRTVLDILPLPFGGDQAAWDAWHKRAVTFTTSIVQTGIDLFEGTLPKDITALLPAEQAKAA